jgi:ABC-type transport system involved in multi-copper enzyme maturation permease subunit
MNGCLVIIERELLGLLRNRKTLYILVATALAFAAVVILKWPSSGISDLNGQQARETWQWLTYAMLGAAILIVPVFPSTSLVREIRGRTLELLLNSPLSRASIYFGKAGAMLGFVLLLLFATLPAMACCFLMGGLSIGDVLRLYGFLLLVCTQLIVVGILVGTYCRSTEAALRWSYGVTFAITIVPTFPDFFMKGGDSPIARAAGWLKLISPIPSLMQLLRQGSLDGSGLSEPHPVMFWYLIFTGLSIVVGSIVCIYRLSHALLDQARSQGCITDEQSLGIRAARRVLYLVDPQRRSAGIPFFLNPVMVKEFRCRQFGRLHWLLRLIAGCAVLSLMLTLASAGGAESRGVNFTGAIIIVLQVALIVLLTPGLAASMIAGEMETGSWNLLRVTPMGPGKILRGKLISVVLTLALLLCATLPGYAVIMLIQPNLQAQVQQVIVCLILAALLSMLISATVSSFFRSTAVATTVAYGILISLFAGTMLVWVNLDAPFGHSLVERTLQFNPLAAALRAIEADGFQNFNLIPSAWWISSILCGLLLIVLYFRVRRLSQPD